MILAFIKSMLSSEKIADFAITEVLALVDASIKNPASRAKYGDVLKQVAAKIQSMNL